MDTEDSHQRAYWAGMATLPGVVSLVDRWSAGAG
jgi:hypothetical protein